jgi:hypothetical protein
LSNERVFLYDKRPFILHALFILHAPFGMLFPAGQPLLTFFVQTPCTNPQNAVLCKHFTKRCVNTLHNIRSGKWLVVSGK